MTDRPRLECSRWEMIVVTAEVCSVSTVCSTMFPLNPAPPGPEGGALIKAFPVLWLTGILSCCGPFTEVTCCWQHWRNGHLCVCSCVFSITLLWAWHQSKMKRPAARSHAHILTPLLLWPCWSAFVFFWAGRKKGEAQTWTGFVRTDDLWEKKTNTGTKGWCGLTGRTRFDRNDGFKDWWPVSMSPVGKTGILRMN